MAETSIYFEWDYASANDLTKSGGGSYFLIRNFKKCIKIGDTRILKCDSDSGSVAIGISTKIKK